jgi:hypothetical protein
MKALKTTIFILSVLVLTTQFARHFYVRFIEPRSSVLDRYHKTETEKAIQKARSLDELVSQYAAAKKRVDELDAARNAAEAGKNKDELDVYRDRFNEEHKDDYRREADLKEAIQEWERRSGEIRELRVFWLFGLAFFGTGAALLVRGREWLGMAFIVPGVIEMIWWTSPSFGLAGSPVEFHRLLMNKLVFTVITLGLLIAAWNRQDATGKKAPARKRRSRR